MDRQAKAIGWEGDSRVGPSPPSEWPAPLHSLHQPPLNKTRGRSVHLPAVYCKACAGRIICRMFYCKACAGHFICRLCLLQGLCRSASPAGPFCYNGLVLPCHALSACLCLDPMPASSCVAFAPVFVHYHVRQDHRACCRDCPVGSRNTGLHWRPVHRFLFTALISRGRPRTACEQPATFPVTCIVS